MATDSDPPASGLPGRQSRIPCRDLLQSASCNAPPSRLSRLPSSGGSSGASKISAGRLATHSSATGAHVGATQRCLKATSALADTIPSSMHRLTSSPDNVHVLKQSLAALERELDMLKVSHQAEQQKLVTEKDAVLAQLQDKLERVQSEAAQAGHVHEELELLQEHVQQLESACRDKEVEMEALKAALAEAQGSGQSGPLSSLEAMQELEEERERLEGELRALRLENKQLQFHAAHREATQTEHLERLQRRLTASDAEVDELKRQLADERDRNSKLALERKQAVSAQQYAEGELQYLQAKQPGDGHTGQGQLWTNLISAEKSIKDLKGQLAKATERAEVAESQCSLLEADKKRTTAESAAASQRASSATAELEEVRRRLFEAESAAARASTEATMLRADTSNNSRQLSDCQRSLQEAEGAAAELRVQAAALGRENQLRKELVADLEARLAETSGRLKAQVTEAAKQYESEVMEATQRADQLQETVSQLKEGLTAAVRQRDELQAEVASRQAAMGEMHSTQQAIVSELDGKARELLSTHERLVFVEEQRKGLEKQVVEAQQQAVMLEGQMDALQGIVGCGDQKQKLSLLLSRIGNLENALAEAEKARRQLHNDLIDIRGNIRVMCRIRPSDGHHAASQIASDAVRIHSDGKPHDFYFDRVLGPDSSQEAVFDCVSDVIQSALDGYHVCLFSYGQTGSGKTFTMNGMPSSVETRGIIPRAISKMLQVAGRLNGAGWSFRLEATFVEIYNEALRDLLGANGAGALDPSCIKHVTGAHTQVMGATKLLVDSEAAVEHIIERASAARATNSTAMNAQSSRSHSVFTLNVLGSQDNSGVQLLGSLNLVDLAGSERLARSQAAGQRQKETCAINKSLSSLGDVFQALANKNPHVPYRNSKLTYLLQPCLGGSGKTIMFVNVSPQSANAYESLCTLRFACKVNKVETAARGGATRNVVAAPAADGTGPLHTSDLRRTVSAGVKAVAPGLQPSKSNSIQSSNLKIGKRCVFSPYKGDKTDSPDSRGSSLPAFKRRR